MSRITKIMEDINVPTEARAVFEKVLSDIEKNDELSRFFGECYEKYFELLSGNVRVVEAKILDGLAEKSKVDRYTINAVFLLYCTDRVWEKYRNNGYSRELFVSTMEDMVWKIEECKRVYDVYGIFAFEWYSLFFKLNLFRLGRLQYEIFELDRDCFDYAKKGDRVLSCHIPSCGPIKDEDCVESYKMAYDFFKDLRRDDGSLIIICESWMLYPPHYELFPEGGNLRKFYDRYKNFDIVHDENNSDSWRIFGTDSKDYKSLPQNTSLQRAFYKYLNDGNHMGFGYGVMVMHNA